VQPAVVVPFDPLEGGDLDRIEAAPRTVPVDQLGLEQPDLGLGEGVVVGVADAADAGRGAGFGEPFGEPDRGVLGTGVGVVHQPGQVGDTGLLPGPDRHLQRVEHQLGAHARRGAPADDPAGERVEHERDEDHPGPGRDIGVVRDPQRIRSGRVEVPLDQVRRAAGRRIGPGRADPTLPRRAPRSPSTAINRSTVHRATAMPSRLSASQTFRAP